MARLLRHRQTKETETDTPSLTSAAPPSYSTGPQATLQDRSAAPHLPCLNNTSNGRTGRKAARRYILSCSKRDCGAGMLIGKVLQLDGAYVATGHNVWGILNAPATGEALAELIGDGVTRTTDLTPFDPTRLLRLG